MPALRQPLAVFWQVRAASPLPALVKLPEPAKIPPVAVAKLALLKLMVPPSISVVPPLIVATLLLLSEGAEPLFTVKGPLIAVVPLTTLLATVKDPLLAVEVIVPPLTVIVPSVVIKPLLML